MGGDVAPIAPAFPVTDSPSIAQAAEVKPRSRAFESAPEQSASERSGEPEATVAEDFRRERSQRATRNPYAGERKIQVNPRLFPTLWARYDRLASDVRAGGGRATVTDLVNAVLHFRGPETPEDAQALLTRFRTLLAQDPPREP